MRHFTVHPGMCVGFSPRRRGVVAVFTVVMMVVLVGFAGMTIDVGVMQMIRADLQRTADAAALAAIQDLRDADPWTMDLARSTAEKYVKRNPILKAQPALFNSSRDIVFGRATLNELDNRVDFAAGVMPPNALRLTVHYKFDYMFARVFGRTSRLINASAMSAAPPPQAVDVIPASLPVPGFGPVDPDIADHNPGKTSPSEPTDGVRFEPGEEVAVFMFGKGPRQPVHLVLDITDSNGVAGLNELLATEEALGGTREPATVYIGDEYYVWGEGTGNANFGEKLETRIADDDTDNDTVVVPIIEALPDSRNADGELANKVRVVDFAAVTLTEIREVEVADPDNPGKTMMISVLFGNIVETFSGSNRTLDPETGQYTQGSVKSSPMLLM